MIDLLVVVQVANKNDLIAVEEGAVKSLFSSKVDLSKRGDAFSLGDRDKILEAVEEGPILVHIAQAQNQRWVCSDGLGLQAKW